MNEVAGARGDDADGRRAAAERVLELVRADRHRAPCSRLSAAGLRALELLLRRITSILRARRAFGRPRPGASRRAPSGPADVAEPCLRALDRDHGAGQHGAVGVTWKCASLPTFSSPRSGPLPCLGDLDLDAAGLGVVLHEFALRADAANQRLEHGRRVANAPKRAGSARAPPGGALRAQPRIRLSAGPIHTHVARCARLRAHGRTGARARGGTVAAHAAHRLRAQRARRRPTHRGPQPAAQVHHVGAGGARCEAGRPRPRRTRGSRCARARARGVERRRRRARASVPPSAKAPAASRGAVAAVRARGEQRRCAASPVEFERRRERQLLAAPAAPAPAHRDRRLAAGDEAQRRARGRAARARAPRAGARPRAPRRAARRRTIARRAARCARAAAARPRARVAIARDAACARTRASAGSPGFGVSARSPARAGFEVREHARRHALAQRRGASSDGERVGDSGVGSGRAAGPSRSRRARSPGTSRDHQHLDARAARALREAPARERSTRCLRTVFSSLDVGARGEQRARRRPRASSSARPGGGHASRLEAPPESSTSSTSSRRGAARPARAPRARPRSQRASGTGCAASRSAIARERRAVTVLGDGEARGDAIRRRRLRRAAAIARRGLARPRARPGAPRPAARSPAMRELRRRRARSARRTAAPASTAAQRARESSARAARAAPSSPRVHGAAARPPRGGGRSPAAARSRAPAAAARAADLDAAVLRRDPRACRSERSAAYSPVRHRGEPLRVDARAPRGRARRAPRARRPAPSSSGSAPRARRGSARVGVALDLDLMRDLAAGRCATLRSTRARRPR